VKPRLGVHSGGRGDATGTPGTSAWRMPHSIATAVLNLALNLVLEYYGTYLGTSTGTRTVDLNLDSTSFEGTKFSTTVLVMVLQL
jgi:hypothetical protein